ncbi:hypothetical protein RCL1_004529 [Eukaryota sp. TZLM3-RCL]
MTLLSLIKKLRVEEKQKRVLMLGLDSAGKTTVVKSIFSEDTSTMSPTFGFDIRTLKHPQLTLNIWDIGGQTTIRSYWRNYFDRTDAIIWVVDSFDVGRLDECFSELFSVLSSERLLGVTLLVLANKQDIPGALTAEEVREELGFSNEKVVNVLSNRKWAVFPISAAKNQGITSSLDWLINDLLKSSLSLENDDDSVQSKALVNDVLFDLPRLIEMSQSNLIGLKPDLRAALVKEWDKILGKYLDFPELLDSILENLVLNLQKQLEQLISNQNFGSKITCSIINDCSSLINLLTRIVSNEKVYSLFSRSFDLFPVVFNCLTYSANHVDNHFDWMTIHSVLFWLAELLLTPFDLIAVNQTPQSILSSILTLMTSSVNSTPCSLVVSRLMVRKESIQSNLIDQLLSLLTQLIDLISTNNSSPINRITSSIINFEVNHSQLISLSTCLLQSIEAFYRICPSDVGLSHAESGLSVLSKLIKIELIQSNLLIMKIVLETVRNLATLLLDPDQSKNRDFELMTSSFSCYSLLLAHLSSSSTNLRWQSAQGIGKIIEKLPDEEKTKVLSRVQSNLIDSVDDDAIHGHLLCLAEILRKIKITKSGLQVILSFLPSFLTFDKPKGGRFVGANVRDAACFVLWSIIRSESNLTAIIDLSILVFPLLCMSLFDRELYCRRAASATLQELIGRNSNQIHRGLDIVTTVDFMRVGNVSQSFVDLAVKFADDVYGSELLRHLIDFKIYHWDSKIRSLATEVVGLIGSKIGIKMIDQCRIFDVLITSIKKCSRVDLVKSHGAFLMLHHLINQNLINHESQLISIVDVISFCVNSNFFTGKNDEVRYAFCLLLRSTVNLKISSEIFELVLKFMFENLSHDNESIQNLIALILNDLILTDPDNFDLITKISEFIYSKLILSNSVLKRGIFLFVSICNQSVLSSIFDPHLVVIVSENLNEKFEVDPYCRVAATKALVALMKFQSNLIGGLFPKILNQFTDYQVDNRGDVGSFVRLSAITSSPLIFDLISSDCNQSRDLIVAILEQSISPISKIRQACIQTSKELITKKSSIIFEDQSIIDCLVKLSNLDNESDTFSIIFPLIFHNFCSINIWRGVVVTFGGKTDYLQKSATSSIVESFKMIGQDESIVDQSILSLITLWSQNVKSPRLSTPIIITVHKLIDLGIIDLTRVTCCDDVISLIKQEMSKSSDFSKLESICTLLSSLLSFSSTRLPSLKGLLLLSNHSMAKVRVAAVNSMYSGLVLNDALTLLEIFDDDVIDRVADILTQTEWSGSGYQEIRLELFNLLGLEPPKKVVK